jgi:chorismate synthase
MAGNSFGQLFRITTFGESHGPGIGVVIDGCPSNLKLDTDAIQRELTRRRPGQSALTTSRDESDTFQFLSGVVDDTTTGAPLTIWIPNKDQRSADYSHIEEVFRPSHADYTYHKKYGVRDVRGGGRSSARETAARVAAGAVARQLLQTIGIECVAYVSSVGEIAMAESDRDWSTADVDATAVRCPHPESAVRMTALIEEVRDAGDTVGGTISCFVRNCPAGFGEPVYAKLHAELGSAILSINACKGFEIGSGFSGTRMRGSEHNDPFVSKNGIISTTTNHSGGVLGGISNGMDIVFRAAFKPVSTLMQPQESVDQKGNPSLVAGKGRHDPCVVPRAVPIVEAMALIVLADHWLRSRAGGPIVGSEAQ